MEKIINFVHNILKEKITNNDIVVDMTVGNGHDTLFLCEIAKYVYGFDIQSIAIDNTNKLLNENNKTNYQLILDSHEFIDKYINNKVKAFIYNLGYLPTGNKDITTNVNSTISSLKKALELLDEKGIIALVIYEGHKEGNNESKDINDFVCLLDQKKYDVVTYKFINQINNPPYGLFIERR